MTAQFNIQMREVFARIASVTPALSCKAYQMVLRNLIAFGNEQAGCNINSLSAEAFSGWLGTQPGPAKIAQIKTLFKMWINLRGKGIDVEALELGHRVIVPKSDSYANVLTWDSDFGPYRPSEDEAIRIALDDAFNEGDICINKYALFRVLRGTGMRIGSVVDLKLEDLRQDNGRWFLRIPHEKQRGVAGWRVQFMPWKPISQGLANVLQMHIEANVLPKVHQDTEVQIAPLFPRVRAKDLSLPSAHLPTSTAQSTYKSVIERLAVVSPITGRIITGHPHRDRHTYLTMLAMNGCTADEIAANAGHSSSKSSEPYVHAAIDHFQRMEKFVGAAFIPIADRFLGAVTTSARDSHADDPIIDAHASGVGSCQIGGCSAIEAGVAPLACYTCRKFRAWADAPHADLLEMLIEDVERLRAEGHATVADTRLPTIIAIGDLLERIRQEGGQDDG
ncbi:MAG: hypothetical protein DCO81_07690 [Candidatus Aquiluna sp. XM-24bin5]|nr:MAG: hypothetical protein DCO81_07690 [Candidatus Aquiluna sp. XM-24bin5]